MSQTLPDRILDYVIQSDRRVIRNFAIIEANCERADVVSHA